MILVEKTKVFGFEPAIRGMRNSYNSWDNSDSLFNDDEPQKLIAGEKDLYLMHKLYNAGPSHSKFMRMITVYMDVTAPLYWWKEYDTYKVGTATNSCSTMHSIIGEEEFNMDDFSHEELEGLSRSALLDVVYTLNTLRSEYLDTKNLNYWYAIIQLLPESYNQKRTINFNYQVASEIINQRKEHRLSEWRKFCDILNALPYLHRIMKGRDHFD